MKHKKTFLFRIVELFLNEPRICTKELLKISFRSFFKSFFMMQNLHKADKKLPQVLLFPAFVFFSFFCDFSEPRRIVFKFAS